jgi:hypothetical protein
MVAPHNPCCPVSLGFVGFLSAIVSRQSSLYKESKTQGGSGDRSEEEEDLLAVGEADCDELTDDRITSFLESQKQQYYRSIGMAPPKQLKTIETLTTPGASMIEFSSSRETSYIDEGEEPALLNLEASTPDDKTAFTPQTFRMDEDSELDRPPSEARQGNVLETTLTNAANDLPDSDVVVEQDDGGFITPTSPGEEPDEDAYLSP